MTWTDFILAVCALVGALSILIVAVFLVWGCAFSLIAWLHDRRDDDDWPLGIGS